MRAQILKELEGKDLRRVAGQLRHQARLQRARIRAGVLGSCSCVVALAYHLYSRWMSTPFVVIAILFLLLWVPGSLADLRAYRYQKQKLAVIAELLPGA